jgi:hypothetical protein
MKLKLVPTMLLFAAWYARGQGTFIYDQQSSVEARPGEVVAGIQANQPIGQSFTPSLSSIGFIRLQLLDLDPGNGLGATLLINLGTDSITGPVLGSTDPLFLADGFPGPPNFVDFFFSTPASVAPGTTYYFQPVVQSGEVILLGRFIMGSDYAGGNEFLQGQPGNNDLWFREGIVVPEPSALSLLLAGVALLLCRKLAKR